MWTSVILKTKDNKNLFGRTMDFSVKFNESVRLIPRKFKWTNVTDIYYYHTYENSQISAVHLFNEDLDGSLMKEFPSNKVESINNIN